MKLALEKMNGLKNHENSRCARPSWPLISLKFSTVIDKRPEKKTMHLIPIVVRYCQLWPKKRVANRKVVLKAGPLGDSNANAAVVAS